MNGNDLNNMAKRYKEEMMRLYQKSGSAQRNTAQQNGIMGRGAGMSGSPMQTQQAHQNHDAVNQAMHNNRQAAQMTRDTAGTPVPGVPGASFYGMNNDMGDSGCSSHEHNHEHKHSHNNAQDGVSVPLHCDCRFPSAESIINSIANTPMTLPITPEDNPPPAADGNSTPIEPRNTDMSAENSSGNADAGQDVRLRSVIVNTSPEEATFSVPSQADEESEVMPDFSLPSDIPAESEDIVPSTARFRPSPSWVSLTGDNSWGFLQFEVFTADGAYPVPGALVVVKKRLPGGIGLLRILFTNRNGRTATIALPAPSLMQPTANAVRPFSEYEVTVRARGYYTLRNISVGVYAGSKTVQPIDMIPLPGYPSFNPPPPQPRTDGASDNSVG